MKRNIKSYFKNPKNLRTEKVDEDDISKKLLCKASTSTEIMNSPRKVKDVEDSNNSFGDFLACNYEEEQLQDSSSNDSDSSDEHVSFATFIDTVDINSSIDSSSCTLEISKTTPGSKDLAQHLDDGPKQPILVFYPKTKFSNRMRHFSHTWYKMFNWIDYSVMNDGVFCFPYKSSGFKRHESSSEHKKCQVMLIEYTSMKGKNISVSSLINEAHLKLVKENCRYIQYIGKALLFTAVQGIAQRGDDESENSVNRGKFLELVHLLEYFNDDFKQKRQSLPNNSKYTSPSMQN
ncbi:uncharacterized protein LOC132939217 [Metopolophium dirhodum]|uniref:uncharacterized protein LOC132939217 n=1 Tax=Metopolophium dirhodum TaxID=44670 RepID=UPI00298F4322|nr:uncharacterized protein LOC132939217 [Metopolophium dirhodum]